jgi:ABC-type uncharacterized transport system substrate-binding protein
MNRRAFIAGLGGAAAWPLVARAQQPAIPLIGFLYGGTEQAQERNLASFRDGLRQLGYAEGSNIRFEFRFADGYLDRLPDLAVDLVRLNPNVIVSAPLPAHLAVRRATSAIPIVMATGADPVGFGLVALDRFESARLVVEVSEIIVHKADQPNLVAHLFDTNALAGEDDAEIDLAAIEADAAACGHGGGSIVEWIIELRQASVGSG